LLQRKLPKKLDAVAIMINVATVRLIQLEIAREATVAVVDEEVILVEETTGVVDAGTEAAETLIVANRGIQDHLLQDDETHEIDFVARLHKGNLTPTSLGVVEVVGVVEGMSLGAVLFQMTRRHGLDPGPLHDHPLPDDVVRHQK
jgi:hypothetical protein